MQFTFNGNMDELKEFVEFLSLAQALDSEIEKEVEPYRPVLLSKQHYIESLNNLEHFSHTSHKWVKYADMHPVYLINIIRQQLKDSTKEVLVNQHFLSAVLALANRIVEENQGYEDNPECPL